MSNVPPWMNKWSRSPRQDRRVIEDGKFVELGKVQLPEPPPTEEQQESALEVVHGEGTDQGTSTAGNVSIDDSIGSSGRGDESDSQSDAADRQTETGVVLPISDSSISTAKELTEEQSDALAETLRLPEDGLY